MALACLDNATPADLGQRGTFPIPPDGHENPRTTRYSWRHLPQLLDAGQYLLVDLEKRSLTLRQGRGVLAQAFLRPLVFRMFLSLLVALRQGRSSPYAEFLALKEAPEEQLVSLLKNTKAGLIWLEEATDMQRRLLQQQGAAGRESVLKPLRKAIREPGGLGSVLAARRFPWEVLNRYGRGYCLVRVLA